MANEQLVRSDKDLSAKLLAEHYMSMALAKTRQMAAQMKGGTKRKFMRAVRQQLDKELGAE